MGCHERHEDMLLGHHIFSTGDTDHSVLLHYIRHPYLAPRIPCIGQKDDRIGETLELTRQLIVPLQLQN